MSRPVRYALLVGLPLIALALVLRLGGGSAVPVVAAPRAPSGLDLGLLLAQLIAVLLAARLCGLAARRIGQPQVVGEMAAGILLGPSFLGLVAPAFSAALFPAESLGALNALAQVGLVLFMFVVGLEVDPAQLRDRGDTAVFTSHASIAVPFALGAALALPLHPRLAPPGVGFVPFALFLGAAMSVTAFPVLARILAERRMTRTPLGAIALAAAAVDDVTAWAILAVVVLLARAAEGVGASLAATIGGTAAFALAMWLVVRPLLARLFRPSADAGGGDGVTDGAIAIAVAVALAGAWTTEALGVHALFGAFVAGTVMPRAGGVAHALARRFETVLSVVLLPVFFAFTGLRTEIGLVEGAWQWAAAGAILVVAVAGKLAGSAIGARLTGLPWRGALVLGVLMNTRGLMELVVLNIGLDVGVLSRPLFAMMVLMALATTCMTSPLLGRLRAEAEKD